MKRIWYLIIVLCILALGDIVFSIVVENNNSVNDREYSNETVELAEKNRVSERHVSVPNPQKKVGDKVPTDLDAALHEKRNKSITYTPKECLDFAGKILAKDGLNLTKEDLSFLSQMQETVKREGMVRLFGKYQICRSFEIRDIGNCNQLADNFDFEQTYEDCKLRYRLMIPFQAHYVMEMTPEQFRDLYEDEEKELKDWMYEFFLVLYNGDHDACKRIADNRDMMKICQYASGAITDEPEDENWKKLYLMFIAIRTGKLSYLVKVKHDAFLEAFVKAALGRKNACNEYYESQMKSFCNTTDQND